ncbi:MAG: TatD family hydrolase [Planctomycetota bacterium]|nr:TatD family hydrolase [Planctomycetota bacterium]
MRLYDTHCHLAWRAAEDPPVDQIARARAVGVEAIVCVAIDAATSVQARELARSMPETLRASVGLHPNDAGDADALTAHLARLEQLAAEGGFHAVGETGLDFYRDHSSPAVQERALEFQLDLARRYDLPVILHCRQAAARLLEVLEASGGPLRGVMHCFSEGPETVDDFLALGLHVSFAGNLSYPKSESIREAARRVPDHRLLIETDAPFLAPQPRRGRPNEPAFVAFTLEALAAARAQPAAELAAATWRNACALFGGS